MQIKQISKTKQTTTKNNNKTHTLKLLFFWCCTQPKLSLVKQNKHENEEKAQLKAVSVSIFFLL